MSCQKSLVACGILFFLTGCGAGESPAPPPPHTLSLAQQAYVKASNTERTDGFGGRVALDGSTLAVGVPNEDSSATGVAGDQGNDLINGTDSGAVYVFTRSSTGVWSQQAYVKASNTGAGDGFGRSVALDDDTLVVGAPFEDSSAKDVNGNQGDDSASNSGAVYVFTRGNSGSWIQQAYLKATDTEADDNFGMSVALSGDTMVVGAPAKNKNTNNSGSVYVFTRTNGVWASQSLLKASNAEAGDGFGGSVALDGNTLVVGASFEDSIATGVDGDQGNDPVQGTNNDSGAVYVFTKDSNGSWKQEAYLKASNAGAADGFGTQVALDGDTVAVGAASEDNGAKGIDREQDGKPDVGNAFNSGAVYVFTRSGTAWTQQAYLKASNTGATDGFGRSVALAQNTLAVGAWLEDSHAKGINGDEGDDIANAKDSGAVYLFARSNGVWTKQTDYVKASNTGVDDHFGISVALSGGTVAVGASGESSSATGINGSQEDDSESASGAAYLYVIE